MSNFLSFLSQGVELQEVEAKKSRPKSNVENNPSPAFLGFRLWYDGSVYPSRALVDQYALEYPKATIKEIEAAVPAQEATETTPAVKAKPAKKEFEYASVAYGLDVIDSAEWTQFPAGAPRGLLIAVVPKTEPKVDLFAGVRYEADGTPMSTVMDQGANTFGSTIIATCNELFNVKMGNGDGEVKYIDFRVETSMDLKVLVKNGIFIFPKKVTRGENKDKSDYIRRENVSVFGLEGIPAPVTRIGTEEAEEEDVNAGAGVSPQSEA